jgi:hypothetical protein
MTLFTGGGGGGGGGANGGGGGGGGGAVKIIAVSVDIPVGGSVLANGGQGGGKLSGSCVSGGGGGAGGGMIWLEAFTLNIAGGLDATGGIGAMVNSAGGDGADGRIQVSSPGLSQTGAVTPASFTRFDAPACP